MMKYISILCLIIALIILWQDKQLVFGIVFIIISMKLDLMNNHKLFQGIKNKNYQFQEKLEEIKTNLDALPVKKKSFSPIHIEEKIIKLNNRINNLATEKLSTNQLEELISRFDFSIKQQIQDFNQLVKRTRPSYELILDRDGSRKVLLEALKKAQSRIILVCPWIAHGVDNEVIEYCKAFLKKGGSIDLGWGHLNDINKDKHEFITRDEFLKIVKSKNKYWAYNNLEKFIELEKQYPQKMNLRLLGTHEKFLICDNSFAMIGSHNFLTSNLKIQEREIGLKFNDLNIIKDLVNRFENGSSLEPSKKSIKRSIPKPRNY